MRVLLTVHGFPPRAYGGTELYTHDLAHALARTGDEVTVLAREAEPSRPEYALREEAQGPLRILWVNHTFREAASFEDTYRNVRLAAAVAPVLETLRPEVAHLQHLTCLSTELVFLLRQRGIPVLFTLNDFWMLCQRGQLLDLDYQRCPGPSPEGCARCMGPQAALGRSAYRAAALARRVETALPSALQRPRTVLQRWAAQAQGPSGEAVAALEERLRHAKAVLHAVNLLHAPSRTVEDLLRNFGVDDSRIVRLAQGIEHAPFAGLGRTEGQRLRIGFLGSLMVSKAPHLLLEAFARLPRGKAELHLYGAFTPYHGDARYREVLEPLLGAEGVTHHGPLSHAEVPKALASLDVLGVPSVWLENAPFIIKEAALAGVPTVASAHGGMAELVTHERNGLLFEPGSAAALAQALRRLLDEPGLLPRLRAGLPSPLTMEEDAAQLRGLYRRIGSGRPPRARRRSLGVVVVNFRTYGRTAGCVKALLEQEPELPPAQVVVVDNGSKDNSARLLRRALPGVRLLEAPGNLGFSGGVNLGLDAALSSGVEEVLLLNSDVRLAEGALATLREALDSDAEAGIAAPVLLCAGAPEVVESAGASYHALSGRMRHPEFGMRLGARPLDTRAVDAVSGCVMLVRREVFNRVGLLDERYFYGFEDLELCLRARRAGFRTLRVGAAQAFHEGSASIGRRAAARLYFAARNHQLLAQSVAPLPRPVAALRGAGIFALNLAYALTRSEAERLPAAASVLWGTWDHLRGRYGAGPLR